VAGDTFHFRQKNTKCQPPWFAYSQEGKLENRTGCWTWYLPGVKDNLEGWCALELIWQGVWVEVEMLPVLNNTILVYTIHDPLRTSPIIPTTHSYISCHWLIDSCHGSFLPHPHPQLVEFHLIKPGIGINPYRIWFRKIPFTKTTKRAHQSWKLINIPFQPDPGVLIGWEFFTWWKLYISCKNFRNLYPESEASVARCAVHGKRIRIDEWRASRIKSFHFSFSCNSYFKEKVFFSWRWVVLLGNKVNNGRDDGEKMSREQ